MTMDSFDLAIQKNAAGSCGRIRFSLKSAPLISEVSAGMRAILGIPDGDGKWLQALSANPAILFSEENEAHIRACVDTVCRTGEAAVFEGELFSIDRVAVPVWGVIDRIGMPEAEEYVAILYDRRPARERRTAYLRAHYTELVKGVSEWVCEINLSEKTAKCLYSQIGFADNGVRISLWDALKLRLEKQVAAEDRERLQNFFHRGLVCGRGVPYLERIEFSLRNKQGVNLPYLGVLIGIGCDCFLFSGMPQFCMSASDRALTMLENTLGYLTIPSIVSREAFEKQCQTNRQEQIWKAGYNLFVILAVDDFDCYSLEECHGLQQAILFDLKRWRDNNCIISRFDENLFVLCEHEIQDATQSEAHAAILFREISQSVQSFGTTISMGVSYCKHDYEGGFQQAYDEAHQALAVARESGGGRYTVYSREIHRDAAARRRTKRRTERGHVVDIVTFGNFNVFVDGSPILFRHEKSKELLALLVDRRGGYATAESLISFLWENESASERTYARLRKVAMRLRETLQSYGVEDIFESVSGKRRIVVARVNCDLYDYLAQDRSERERFRGNYLVDYSWSEDTLGELISDP